MGIFWLTICGAATGLAAILIALVGVMQHRWLLLASSLGAASAVLLVTGWLLADPSVSKADALKTGGLAGGAILALYALWINDRRRRTEEARQEVERGRAQQDRERVSDERFAKAVELLGHDADQVRVGALHALAGLARSRPSYTQTVLDALCSYLRRPFTHPSYQLRLDNPDQAEDVQPALFSDAIFTGVPTSSPPASTAGCRSAGPDSMVYCGCRAPPSGTSSISALLLRNSRSAC